MLLKKLKLDSKFKRIKARENKHIEIAREHAIFNSLYDAIENTEDIESLHAILTEQDFKKIFYMITIACNRQIIIDLIDKKINQFQEEFDNMNIEIVL